MGDTDPSGTSLRKIVRKRAEMLDSIESEPADKPGLVDRLDVSRSTVDRAVDTLRDADLVRRDGNVYRVTIQGRHALSAHQEYVERTDAVAEAGPLLGSVPESAEVNRRLIRTGTVRLANPNAPEKAIMGAVRELESARQLSVFSPVIKSNYVRPVHEQVSTRGLETRLVLGRGATESMAELATVTDIAESLVSADSFSLYTTDRELPFLLYLMRGEESDAVGITVHEKGGIVGTVTTENPEAAAWGRDLFEDVLEEAEAVEVSEFV